MLKQQLQQKLQQKLSPAQIQAVKILEITTLELEERIRQELEENPALEEGAEPAGQEEEAFEEDYDAGGDGGNNDDMELEEYMPDDDIPDYKLRANNASKDDEKRDSIPFSAGMTFHEHLLGQLGLQDLTEHERELAEYVIGNVDEDGYLRRTPEAMVDDIVFQQGVQTTDEEMRRIVDVIRGLDPAGVGATDLRDCLLLQLDRRTPTDSVRQARQVVAGYFNDFSRKRYDKIMKALSLDDAAMKRVVAEIVRLNPKPGSAWSGNVLERSMSTIVPDFILENDEGHLTVHLNNGNVPELRVSSTYNEMLQDYAGNKANQTKEMKDAVLFMKQKIDSARWFIDAVKQRQQTLLTTMQAIVDFQHDYFLEGDETRLRPMILQDISDRTGYDKSTISRVSSSKYIQTDFGIFPVKYFFSESMTNDSGEEVSTREIKTILQDTVDHEDKRDPLNDDRLADILKEKGYPVARRTVAKYREQLGIPVARLRREV